MPPKPNQITLIRRMDERIAALEGEMAGVKASLSSLEQGQATLIAMFEKSLGKRKEGGVMVDEETPETGSGPGSKPHTEASKTGPSNDEALLEFRQAVKWQRSTIS